MQCVPSVYRPLGGAENTRRSKLNSFHGQKSAGDVARAVGFIEIINQQSAVFRNHRRPGITQITVAAVVAKDDFRRRFDVFTFRIQEAGANAEGRMAITIKQEHLFVWQSQRVMGMSLEPGVLPMLK